MRNLLLLGLLVGGAFMAGWFTIERDGDRTRIEINKTEIRQDTRQAIERGREFIDQQEQDRSAGSNPVQGAGYNAPVNYETSGYPPNNYSNGNYGNQSTYPVSTTASGYPPANYPPSHYAPANYAPANYAPANPETANYGTASYPQQSQQQFQPQQRWNNAPPWEQNR